MTAHKVIYRVNITKLSVEPVTITELQSERSDGAEQVEVMPSGMLRPLDQLGYYADTEKEAATALFKYIAVELKETTDKAKQNQAAFKLLQERAELLLGILNELELEGHGLPERWEI